MSRDKHTSRPPEPGEDDRNVSETSLQRDDAGRTRRAFLANLRHELRTPLNAIIGYSEMLLEDAEDTGQEEFIPDLQKIHAAGKQLLSFVNEILDQKKIEAGHLDLDLETLGVNLRHELRTPLNAVIGYVEILLEDAEDADQEDFLPDLRRIHTAAERFLALINDIVNFVGIGVEGIETELQASGTVAMAWDVVKTMCPLEEHAFAAAQEHGALLVVDDNEMNRDLLSHHLERQGQTVTTAENGRQALKIVKTQALDLILLDIIMPEMNGYQVLEILKTDETLRNIPVIMISALDEMDSVIRCIKMGAEDYLPKPFNPVLLKARIGASLEEIKTIGDAYTVVGGLPEPRPDHAEAVAAMALDMHKGLARFNEKHAQSLSIRIGIHTGPVVAGVIGTRKFSYDLWGDTVNTASRMESHGVEGRIQVIAATYSRLKETYRFEKRGAIQVKGKGEMMTYLLLGHKSS